MAIDTISISGTGTGTVTVTAQPAVVGTPPGAPDAHEAAPGRPRPRSGWATLRRRPSFVASVVIVLFWIVAAVGWRWFGLDPFADTTVRLGAPSPEHLFGTDHIGRDMFARVLAGAEPALLIGPAGTLIATVLGSAMGLLAGYFRGWVDTVFMRIFDVFLALPTLIFLLVIVGAFGSGVPVLILTVGLVFAPGIARIVRAAVLVEMGKQYVASAHTQRESWFRIIVRELLPNVSTVIVVQATLSLGAAIFISATLSFLGLAAQPPSPDWGLAISENRVYLQSAWWTLVFPAAGIASLVVAVNLIADNVKEVFRR